MIGNQPTFGPRLFNGLIDEVEIFDRELAAIEVQAIYNAGSAGKWECALSRRRGHDLLRCPVPLRRHLTPVPASPLATPNSSAAASSVEHVLRCAQCPVMLVPS